MERFRRIRKSSQEGVQGQEATPAAQAANGETRGVRVRTGEAGQGLSRAALESLRTQVDAQRGAGMRVRVRP